MYYTGKWPDRIEVIYGSITLDFAVYVQFVVNSEGKMVDVKVIRGAHPLLDAEAIRVVQSSPDREPGKQRGKKVCAAFTFPIIFALD